MCPTPLSILSVINCIKSWCETALFVGVKEVTAVGICSGTDWTVKTERIKWWGAGVSVEVAGDSDGSWIMLRRLCMWCFTSLFTYFFFLSSAVIQYKKKKNPDKLKGLVFTYCNPLTSWNLFLWLIPCILSVFQHLVGYYASSCFPPLMGVVFGCSGVALCLYTASAKHLPRPPIGLWSTLRENV